MKRTFILFLIGMMNMNPSHGQTSNEFWAEDFLAEVIFDHITEENSKTYIEKELQHSHFPSSQEKFRLNFGIIDSTTNVYRFGFYDDLPDKVYDCIFKSNCRYFSYTDTIYSGFLKFIESQWEHRLKVRYTIFDSFLYSDDSEEIASIKRKSNENLTVPQRWNENAPVFQQSKYKNLIFVDGIYKLPLKVKINFSQWMAFSNPIFTENGEYAFITYEIYTLSRYRIKNWQKPWLILKHPIFSTLSIYNNLYRRIDGKWVLICKIYVGGGHS